MTIYNINLGIGWASSGVEYAQAYRAKIFRNIKAPAKFVFMEMIQYENIQNLTENLGLKDEEVVWLYQSFTDIKIAPTTYTLEDLKASFDAVFTHEERNEAVVRYFFEGDFFITAYLKDSQSNLVNRAEFVSRGNLIRKDYYSYTRIYSEYYTPRDDRAYLYQRRFFNEDGTTAYEEIIDGKDSVYRFKDRILYTYPEFVAYFIERLQLSEKDVIILDRETGIGQAILQHKGKAKIGVVVHAEHYSENMTDEHTILWNNYYEYQFQKAHLFDFFITATSVQKDILQQQLAYYDQVRPRIYDIPVGSVAELTYPKEKRKPLSLITASRLADEKHIDWLVKAVIKAVKKLPGLTFDIYGEGGERGKLATLIKENEAEAYIRLMGHKHLSEIYANYEVYLAASTSEGFGLTLLEAIGSGLPIIGFDVPYGNPTFVSDGKNGYLIEKKAEESSDEIAEKFAEKIVEIFSNDHLEASHQASYRRAEDFLTSKVEDKWKVLIEEVTHD